jgi:hypothetical protein
MDEAGAKLAYECPDKLVENDQFGRIALQN